MNTDQWICHGNQLFSLNTTQVIVLVPKHGLNSKLGEGHKGASRGCLITEGSINMKDICSKHLINHIIFYIDWNQFQWSRESWPSWYVSIKSIKSLNYINYLILFQFKNIHNIILYRFGPNSFPPPKIKTLWELIMENFDDQINRILLAAALVSIVIGLIQHGWPKGMLEGTSIMIALCIIIIVSSGNNYASERRLANLVAMADR